MIICSLLTLLLSCNRQSSGEEGKERSPGGVAYATCSPVWGFSPVLFATPTCQVGPVAQGSRENLTLRHYKAGAHQTASTAGLLNEEPLWSAFSCRLKLLWCCNDNTKGDVFTPCTVDWNIPQDSLSLGLLLAPCRSRAQSLAVIASSPCSSCDLFSILLMHIASRSGHMFLGQAAYWTLCTS